MIETITPTANSVMVMVELFGSSKVNGQKRNAILKKIPHTYD
jgi:hypothetical protein